MQELGVNVFKIVSFSLTNYPFLEHVSKKGIPLIASTGLHNLGEIEKAVETIYQSGNNQLALLQCTSHYPSEAKDAHLKVMDTLKYAFQVPVGYSDHTMGINVALASIALGAKIIEKHFTFNVNSFGVDHDASISPSELKKLVIGVREIEVAMGGSIKIIPDIEKEIQKVHRPSLVSKVTISKGMVIKKSMLAIKKPGTGIHPQDMHWVLQCSSEKNKIRDIVEEEGIEIYKGNMLVVLSELYYDLFPKAKWIFISREEDEIVQSMMAADEQGTHSKEYLKELVQKWKKYGVKVKLLKTVLMLNMIFF